MLEKTDSGEQQLIVVPYLLDHGAISASGRELLTPGSTAAGKSVCSAQGEVGVITWSISWIRFTTALLIPSILDYVHQPAYKAIQVL